MILLILFACQSVSLVGTKTYKNRGHNAESVTFTMNLEKLITLQAEFPDNLG